MSEVDALKDHLVLQLARVWALQDEVRELRLKLTRETDLRLDAEATLAEMTDDMTGDRAEVQAHLYIGEAA